MSVHVRKTVSLTIDGSSYECEVTGVTLTPTAEVRTATVLCDDGAVADVAPVTWSLDLSYLVDHAAGSLYRFLIANTGRVAVFEYEPDPETAPGVTYAGDVRILPGPAGGDAGTFESGSVSLPVVGTPMITDPPAAPLGSDEPEPAPV